MSYDELPDSSGRHGRATTVAAVALVVVGSVLWSSSSSASSGISASPSTPQLEALASSGVSASSPSTPQLEALVDDIDYSYSYWEDAVSLLDDSSGSIYVDTEYAQCYTGFCTLNGDGLTASCGCLSLRPSDSAKGELELGWIGAVLAASSAYQDALRLHNDGDDSGAKKKIEAAISNRTLFDGYGFSSTPTRVSLYSTADPYFDASVTECDSVYAAQCMGAPCWDTPYGDSYWNVTCICPYATASESMATLTRASICDDAAEGGDCALIGFGEGATEYTASGLEEMVEAVMAASVTVDTSECPAEYTERR